MLSAIKYWIWLATALEPPAAWLVYNHFGSPEDAFFADNPSYDCIEGLSQPQRAALKEKDLGHVEEILEDCTRNSIHVITWQDADYPERLRNGIAPPLVLYLRGRLCQFDDEAAIAMAGTRRASPYGKQMAREIAYEITVQGGLVVTGIVGGCDFNAATGALRAGGPLVCVTAGGVDVPYYASDSGHRFLADVAAAGTLISQMPPGTPHLGALFAKRNRLLTGLTLGTVCVEAGARSGTLQVAKLAIDQSRDVYAVPANVGVDSAAGTNDLLRQGLAIPVLRGSHVLDHYRHLFPLKTVRVSRNNTAYRSVKRSESRQNNCEKKIDSANSPAYIDLEALRDQFTDDELALFNALREGPLSTDELIEQTGLPAPRTVAATTLLVLRGFVTELPGNRFQLSNHPGNPT